MYCMYCEISREDYSLRMNGDPLIDLSMQRASGRNAGRSIGKNCDQPFCNCQCFRTGQKQIDMHSALYIT
jgi:hypothetical protein